MENGSQALIMAATLIIILMVVSLGTAIFKDSSKVVQNSTEKVDSKIVDIHNSQFIKYDKEVLQRAEVIEMFATAIASNNRNEMSDQKAEFQVAMYIQDLTANKPTNKSANIGPIYDRSILEFYAIDDAGNFNKSLFNVRLKYSDNGVLNDIRVFAIKD